MSDLRERPLTPWYVVRTHPRQEIRAQQNLDAGGIETFLPKMHGRRSRRGAGEMEGAPLFPQYLFARFDLRMRLRDVSFARGVQALLRTGATLAVVDHAVVEFLRSRVDADGLIRVGAPLRPGEEIVIEDGPFAALVGVVERFVPERERVTVLLTAVQWPYRVDVPADAIRRLKASA